MVELNLYTLGVHLYNANYFLGVGKITDAKKAIKKAQDMVEKQKYEDTGLAHRPRYRTILKKSTKKSDGRRRSRRN